MTVESPTKLTRPPDTAKPLGRLIVLTGPSGVGKGTLVRRLRERHPDLYFSVSVTTRPPRNGEEEGVNYFFRTREEFLILVETGGLLEWAEYASNLYGTPRAVVDEMRQSGHDVLLEIELAGARQVFERCPDAIGVFLKPPSLQELERRLRQRAQDSEASIQRRLQRAEAELAALGEFDHVIINDDLEEALHTLDLLLYDPTPASLDLLQSWTEGCEPEVSPLELGEDNGYPPR